MRFPPPTGEQKAELIDSRRKLRWRLAFCLAIFGLACWASLTNPTSWGRGLFDGFFCVASLVFLLGLSRTYRRIGLELKGRAAVLPVQRIGLVCVVSPRKEGASWKVWQLGPYRIWNLAAIAAPPTGRGSSFSRALISLCASLFPDLRRAPKKELEALAQRLEEKFEKDIAELHDRAGETAVE